MKTITTAKEGFLLLIFLAFTVPPAASQSSHHWRQLHSPYTPILFTPPMEAQAQQIAYTLAHFYPRLTYSLKAHPGPLPLILWERNFDSNGCFALPPRRIDFYTQPPPDYNFIGTGDWLTVLTIHEYRHAVQYARLTRNFNSLIYLLGGELALAAMVQHTVPAWLMEGDAVGTETALTQSGRGRIPHFSLLYKVNLLERGGFHYSKQVFGSFRDKIPNHYRVGYYMTTYLRRRYGKEVIDDILEYTTWPRLFPTAIERATGRDLFGVYQDANDELRSLWQAQLEGLQLTSAKTLTVRKNQEYTDYLYPQIANDQQIIALKTGIGTPTQLVCFDRHQKETPLCLPSDISKDIPFSVAGNQLVWVQAVPNMLFPEKRKYAVIKAYDLAKKEVRTLSHHSRYTTAALSADATKIVAVETDSSYQHHLVILSASDGAVIQRLPNPQNCFYLTPRWLANGHQVVAIKHHHQKATIALIDTITGASEDLLPYATELIGVPIPYGPYIFYNSACSGIDNIYALDLVSKRRYQVTSRKYGAYNAAISADGQWMLFNDFTKDGMDIAMMPLRPQEWTPIEEVEDRDIRYYEPLVTQEQPGKAPEEPEGIPSPYAIQPYSHTKHLLHLHSWAWPLHIENETKVGILVQSEDLLRTAQLQAGALYTINDHSAAAFGKLTYKGCIPHISLEGTSKKRLADSALEHIGSINLEVPLTFQRGSYTHLVSGKSALKRTMASSHSELAHEHTLKWSRRSPSSKRDIVPPWKQSISINYDGALFPEYLYQEKRKPRSTLSIQVHFNIPGPAKHHSIRVAPHYTHKKEGDHLGELENGHDSKWTRRKGRSYHRDRNDRWLGQATEDIYALEMRYTWPLYCPDWSVGYLLYVKRLQTSLALTPCAIVTGRSKTYYNHIGQASIVAEIDIPVLNLSLLVGGQAVYRTQTGKWQSGPLFNLKKSV